MRKIPIVLQTLPLNWVSEITITDHVIAIIKTYNNGHNNRVPFNSSRAPTIMSMFDNNALNSAW